MENCGKMTPCKCYGQIEQMLSKNVVGQILWKIFVGQRRIKVARDLPHFHWDTDWAHHLCYLIVPQIQLHKYTNTKIQIYSNTNILKYKYTQIQNAQFLEICCTSTEIQLNASPPCFLCRCTFCFTVSHKSEFFLQIAMHWVGYFSFLE